MPARLLGEHFEGLSADTAFELGNARLVFVGASITGEGVLAILGKFLVPSLQQLGRDGMLLGDLRQGQAGVEFSQNLLFELLGVDPTFETHKTGFLYFLRIPGP